MTDHKTTADDFPSHITLATHRSMFVVWELYRLMPVWECREPTAADIEYADWRWSKYHE
jgi:hypothetical protein